MLSTVCYMQSKEVTTIPTSAEGEKLSRLKLA